MIVVVGGRGVIGASVVDALRSQGHPVVVVTHDARAVGPQTRFGDMLRRETLRPAVRGAEVVIQSANFPNYPMERPQRGWTFEAFDGEGTERLVAAAEAEGVRRYIFIAGAGVSPDNDRPYMRAIWRGEQAVLGSTMEGACVEPTLVFGRRDHGLNRILRVARMLPALPVPGGFQVHQPVFADDLGQLVARCAAIGAPRGRFAIGGPDRMSLEEMLRSLLRVAGLRRATFRVPVQSVELAGSVLERLPRPLVTRRGAEFLSDDFVADNTAILAAFPMDLTSLEAGLRTYLAGADAPPR